jgi:membrane-bound lytic murein transglycosylase D
MRRDILLFCLAFICILAGTAGASQPFTADFSATFDDMRFSTSAPSAPSGGLLSCGASDGVLRKRLFFNPPVDTTCAHTGSELTAGTDETAPGLDGYGYVIYAADQIDESCVYGPTDGLEDAAPAFYVAAPPLDYAADESTDHCRTPDHLFTGPEAVDPEIPIVVNRKVRWFIKYFQTDARYYFVKWLSRTRSYEPLIKGILREEGLPEDLFYLALIESGLNPVARSRANAVGIWQFIKPTALRHGLRVDWWIDERRDPEKATRAAAMYLRNMHDRFGSWYLAAAGYNGGENRVRRAIRDFKSTDFWELARTRRAFKRETRSYVPKYLAAMMIAKAPEAFGFKDVEYGEDRFYEKVVIPYPTDLRVIARAAGVPVREVRKLNPELLHWFTPPDYPDYEIKIPAGTASNFEKNFSRIPRPERLRFHRHRIRPGETLWEIARRYKTRVKLIVYLNDLKNPRLIRAGRTIVVPVRAKGYAGTKAPKKRRKAAPDSRG